MRCPECRFPIHAEQPQMRVHMGVERDAEGYMVDLLPAFHRPCAVRYLIELGRAKTLAGTPRIIVRKDFLKVA